MKQNKQPSTRKQPVLSAEEELAELLADPTLKPSLSFLGLRDPGIISARNESVPDTGSVPDTETVSGTDSAAKGVRSGPRIIFNKEGGFRRESVSDTVPVPDTDTARVGGSVSGTDPVGRAPRRQSSKPPLSSRYQVPKPRQIATVEEGHSHSEQHLYNTLWSMAEPLERETRVIKLGFGAMASLARLSLNNCRLNVRSLIRKLAIEEKEGPHCEQQIGKTYVIHSPSSILRRRKLAGLEWVVRTKGVVFVDPVSGRVLTEPVTPSAGFRVTS